MYPDRPFVLWIEKRGQGRFRLDFSRFAAEQEMGWDEFHRGRPREGKLIWPEGQYIALDRLFGDHRIRVQALGDRPLFRPLAVVAGNKAGERQAEVLQNYGLCSCQFAQCITAYHHLVPESVLLERMQDLLTQFNLALPSQSFQVFLTSTNLLINSIYKTPLEAMLAGDIHETELAFLTRVALRQLVEYRPTGSLVAGGL